MSHAERKTPACPFTHSSSGHCSVEFPGHLARAGRCYRNHPLAGESVGFAGLRVRVLVTSGGGGTALLRQASVEDRNEKGKELCLAL